MCTVVSSLNMPFSYFTYMCVRVYVCRDKIYSLQLPLVPSQLRAGWHHGSHGSDTSRGVLRERGRGGHSPHPRRGQAAGEVGLEDWTGPRALALWVGGGCPTLPTSQRSVLLFCGCR